MVKEAGPGPSIKRSSLRSPALCSCSSRRRDLDTRGVQEMAIEMIRYAAERVSTRRKSVQNQSVIDGKWKTEQVILGIRNGNLNELPSNKIGGREQLGSKEKLNHEERA
ncbi:hypothetical protein chiPu_0003098 [Chiloscyllium punctatum]|uniref:Uncharacterized protein n=1 Tax=Chiloscyllium punctatum TaxID=137246 RepID=A0A401S2U8_CHIPU|nr:hypothetical protein [Chiloscyllium punctatum]